MFARHPTRDPFASARALHSPQPHGTVKSLHRQIWQLLGELQLNLQSRIQRLKIRQRGPQPLATKAEGTGQANQPAGVGLPFQQLLLQRVKSLKQRPGALAQGLSLRTRRYAAGGAVKRCEPQARLQRSQPLGHHRWNDAGCRRSGSQTAVRTDDQ